MSSNIYIHSLIPILLTTNSISNHADTICPKIKIQSYILSQLYFHQQQRPASYPTSEHPDHSRHIPDSD